MKLRATLAFVCIMISCAARAEQTEIIKNGDFAGGKASWSGFASDEEREIAIVDEGGGRKALVLRRNREGAKVQVAQFNLKLKPQTLYRLSVTGSGESQAAVSFRAASSKDSKYADLCKSWATGACPIAPSKGPATETLLFDSGLKADSAYITLRLRGKAPGEYRFTEASLVEVGSSMPARDVTVIAHIGDSITITSYLPFSERVDAVLQGMIEKALPGRKVRNLNLGVDGEWIGQLLDTGRYDSVVKENYRQIDIAVIRYGANDQRKYSKEEFKKRLAILCGNLERDFAGVRIVIGTGPYIHGSTWNNEKQYGPYWQAARDVAADRGYPVADIYKRFEKEATEKTARKKRDAHPGAFGVRLVAEEEFAIISKLLEKPKD